MMPLGATLICNLCSLLIGLGHGEKFYHFEHNPANARFCDLMVKFSFPKGKYQYFIEEVSDFVKGGNCISPLQNSVTSLWFTVKEINTLKQVFFLMRRSLCLCGNSCLK